MQSADWADDVEVDASQDAHATGASLELSLAKRANQFIIAVAIILASYSSTT